MPSNNNNNRFLDEQKILSSFDTTYEESRRISSKWDRTVALPSSIGSARIRHGIRNEKQKGGSIATTMSASSGDFDRTVASNCSYHTNNNKQCVHCSIMAKNNTLIKQQELCQRLWESPETDTLFTSSDDGGTTTISKEENARFNLLLEDMQGRIISSNSPSRPRGTSKKELPPIIIGFPKRDGHIDKEESGLATKDDDDINELLDDIELQLNDMNTIVSSSTVADSSEGTKSLTYMENNDASLAGYDEVVRWLQAKKKIHSEADSPVEYDGTQRGSKTTITGNSHEDCNCDTDPKAEESGEHPVDTGTDKATGTNGSDRRMTTKTERSKSSCCCCCRKILQSPCLVRLILAFCILVALASTYFLVAVFVAQYYSIKLLPFDV